MTTPLPTWEDIAWLREQWGGPFMVKGIMHPDDARRAVDAGATAISVSNHGGNNLDGTPALDPGAARRGGRGRATRSRSLLDGGIRRGSDVVKALALGARAVMIGRAYLWGMAANGEQGVTNVLQILRSGIDEALLGLGRASIHDLVPGGPDRPGELHPLGEVAGFGARSPYRYRARMPQPTPPAGPDLDQALQRWVAAGLIESAQADAIRAAEAGRPAPQRSSLLAEALGYVGGILVLVAAITLTGRYWVDLGTGGRIAVAAGAALVLFVAGAAAPAPHTGPSGRLRAVVWLLSVAALAGTVGLVGDELLDLVNDEVVLLAAAVAALYAALLWRRHDAVPQHVAFVAAIVVAAGSAAALLPDNSSSEVPWLAVWGAGLAWMLLGWGGVVAPRAAAYVCGGAAVMVGSLVFADAGWGALLALGSAALLVVGGVVERDLVLLGVGAVTTFVAVPRVVAERFPDAVAVAFVLLGLGIALVVAGLFVARRRREAGPARQWGTPARAAVAASVVAVGTALAVVGLGW